MKLSILTLQQLQTVKTMPTTTRLATTATKAMILLPLQRVMMTMTPPMRTTILQPATLAGTLKKLPSQNYSIVMPCTVGTVQLWIVPIIFVDGAVSWEDSIIARDTIPRTATTLAGNLE
jgi:hypothetical protein